jgi:hypothetical protein
MMKKALVFLPRLFLFLSFSFLFFRCSEKDTPTTPADLLLGNWSITADTWSPAYDVYGTGQKITDAYAFYDVCEKDNIYTFKASNIGELNEGAAKCDVADPQIIPYTYLLKTNNTQLNISITDQGITIGFDFDIVQLDATTMKLKSTTTENGVAYTNTQTFVHK